MRLVFAVISRHRIEARRAIKCNKDAQLCVSTQVKQNFGLKAILWPNNFISWFNYFCILSRIQAIVETHNCASCIFSNISAPYRGKTGNQMKYVYCTVVLRYRRHNKIIYNTNLGSPPYSGWLLGLEAKQSCPATGDAQLCVSTQVNQNCGLKLIVWSKNISWFNYFCILSRIQAIVETHNCASCICRNISAPYRGKTGDQKCIKFYRRPSIQAA